MDSLCEQYHGDPLLCQRPDLVELALICFRRLVSVGSAVLGTHPV